MSNFDKHVLAFFPTHIRFRPIQRLQSVRNIYDESLVFETIWDCRAHVPMTSMTSSVERTDLDFKISVALFELVRDFMHVLVTCKYKKYRIKNN